jgi:hypothetical protein
VVGKSGCVARGRCEKTELLLQGLSRSIVDNEGRESVFTKSPVKEKCPDFGWLQEQARIRGDGSQGAIARVWRLSKFNSSFGWGMLYR